MGVLRSIRASSRPAPEQADAASVSDPLGRLLKLAGLGDQAAFGELYDSISGLVHGIVLKVVRDPSQTEEVVQEVFVEIWRLAPRYDAERGTVTGWAATIAHRRAVDRVRSEQSTRVRNEREGSKITIEHDSVSDEVVENDHTEFERRRVRKALDKLTDMQRQAVELAYFGGHTYREVAVLLDTPEGTIKTRIRDGMIRLRDELGADHE